MFNLLTNLQASGRDASEAALEPNGQRKNPQDPFPAGRQESLSGTRIPRLRRMSLRHVLCCAEYPRSESLWRLFPPFVLGATASLFQFASGTRTISAGRG